MPLWTRACTLFLCVLGTLGWDIDDKTCSTDPSPAQVSHFIVCRMVPENFAESFVYIRIYDLFLKSRLHCKNCIVKLVS